MPELSYAHLNELDTVQHLDELADLYVRVHAEPPYNSAPKYSREAFLSRTKSQLAKPGFALVTASESQALVGFAFGFQMGPGAWWANATPLPPEISRASKFAVIELLVDARHRGSGIGRELAEQLLAERDEEYATLAARREAPAHGMYLRWGWKPVGRFTTPPYSDVMIVSLAARR